MPTIGYFLGTTFEAFVTSVDHWIAFVLLAIIGGKMIKDAFDPKEEESDDDVSFKTMFVLAVAITFAFFDVNLILAISLIGITSFILPVIGTKIGNKFGNRYEKKAELVGGTILVVLGLKILIEHLNIFG